MALDLVQKVLTEYKADTSQHVNELKKLKDKINDTQRAELEAAEGRSASYEKWLQGLANVNQALELGARAVAFARDAWKTYAEDVRIRAAAGAVSVDKLKAASLGLRTEHELLAFAAKTTNGIIRASEGDMAVAQKAMVALTRAGFDQEEVSKKITEAMVKLETDGLKDLGISLEKGKTPLETYSKLMEELGRRASGVKEGTRTAAESMSATSVSIEESFTKIKVAFGELVQSMSPLLEALAKAVGYVAEIAARAGRAATQGGGVSAAADLASMAGKGADTAGAVRGAAAGTVAAAYVNKFASDFAKFNEGEQAKIEATAQGVASGILGALTGAGKGVSKGTDKGFGKTVSDSEIKSRALQAARMQAEAILHGAKTEGVQSRDGVASSSLGESAGGLSVSDELFKQALGIDPETLSKSWNDRLEQFREGSRTGTREEAVFGARAIFGRTEEWDQYLVLFQTVGDAAQAFGNAVGASYEAIVTGQGSVTKAFRTVLADGLMAMGKSSAIEALRETALAFGSLALGPLGGVSAGMHFKAAAMHGAVAIAAGYAAHSLGTSAQAAASDKAAEEKKREDEKAKKDEEKKSKSGGGSGADGERPIIVVVGEHFSEMSARQRSLRAREEVDRALRERDE